MSETVVDALVRDGGEENPGTAAVFHGMLATMAEVLERLDERLSTLEATIVGQTTATRTTTQRMAAELPDAIGAAVADAVGGLGAPDALARLDARLADVEAAVSRPDTSALEARLDALIATVEAAADRPVTALTGRFDELAPMLEGAARSHGEALAERLDALTAAVEAAADRPAEALTERLDALAAAVEAAGDRPAEMLAERLDALAAAVEAAADRPAEALTERLDALAAAVEAAGDRPAEVLAERLDALAAAVEAAPAEALAERLDGLATTVSDAVEAAAAANAETLTARIDALAGTVVAASAAPGALAAEMRAAVDAALAEARTETGERIERVADALAALASPAQPPDIGALLDERLAAVTAGIADLLTRAGAAAPEESEPTRALARSLARLEADVAEARAETAMSVQAVAARIEEAVAVARGRDEEVLRRAVEAVEAVVANAARIEAAVSEGRAEGERDRKGKLGKAEVETVGRLADRIADLQEAVNRSRGETTTAVERLAAELSERVAAPPPAPAEGTLDELADRLARVEAVVTAARHEDEARATALVSDVQTTLGAGLERLLTHATGNGELVAADIRAALARLAEVGAGVESMSTTLAGVNEQVARLAADDRTRPVLLAIETASHDQQEAVAELQAALVRRIDGRTAALARVLDGVGELGPLLQRLDAAADQDEARAKSLERLLGDLRDDLAKEVGGLAKRQVGSMRLLERVTAALDDEQRRLEGVQSLCQSVAAAVEQQAAVGSRMAELVLETRSAMRSDVERLESTVHLDNVKRQQHDHARLAQVAAGVSEVVERETALVAQRVAALASTVESLRNAFHLGREDLQPTSA